MQNLPANWRISVVSWCSKTRSPTRKLWLLFRTRDRRHILRRTASRMPKTVETARTGYQLTWSVSRDSSPCPLWHMKPPSCTQQQEQTSSNWRRETRRSEFSLIKPFFNAPITLPIPISANNQRQALRLSNNTANKIKEVGTEWRNLHVTGRCTNDYFRLAEISIPDTVWSVRLPALFTFFVRPVRKISWQFGARPPTQRNCTFVLINLTSNAKR